VCGQVDDDLSREPPRVGVDAGSPVGRLVVHRAVPVEAHREAVEVLHVLGEALEVVGQDHADVGRRSGVSAHQTQFPGHLGGEERHGLHHGDGLARLRYPCLLDLQGEGGGRHLEGDAFRGDARDPGAVERESHRTSRGGVAVGESAIAGSAVGAAVGVDVAGSAVGAAVGAGVAGSAVGAAVGVGVAGSAVGAAVGAGVAGSAVGAAVSRAGVSVGRAGVSVGRAGVSVSRAGVSVGRAGVAVSRTGISIVVSASVRALRAGTTIGIPAVALGAGRAVPAVALAGIRAGRAVRVTAGSAVALGAGRTGVALGAGQVGRALGRAGVEVSTPVADAHGRLVGLGPTGRQVEHHAQAQGQGGQERVGRDLHRTLLVASVRLSVGGIWERKQSSEFHQELDTSQNIKTQICQHDFLGSCKTGGLYLNPRGSHQSLGIAFMETTCLKVPAFRRIVVVSMGCNPKKQKK